MTQEHAPYRDDEPGRLPGESRTAYRRRVEPGYDEAFLLKRRRREANLVTRRADQRLELLRSGQITEEEYARRVTKSDHDLDLIKG